MRQRLFKYLGVIAIIISFAGIAFAGSKAEKDFSIFDEAYPSIWSYKDFPSNSYRSLPGSDNDYGDHDWHNDDSDDDYGDHDWHNDDSDDDYGDNDWYNDDSDDSDDSDDDYNVPVVPEPVSSTLFIVGGAALGFRRIRKTLKK